jgi:protein arginine N-methyltransferase 1
MYDLSSYGRMIADPRTEAYRLALARAITPDTVVLDIGAGPGIFSLLAARLGARRVYAVEPDESLELARRLAAENGLQDRIEFFPHFSREVTLPERAHVLVSDLRGVLPPSPGHIPAVVDARRRLLVDNPVLIPVRDTMRGAPVCAPEAYARLAAGWDLSPMGLGFGSVRRMATNYWIRAEVCAEQLLAEPCTWAVLDYARVTDADVRGTMRWTVERAETAHGFAVWFDAALADGVGFSNAPGPTETVYNRGFFPWPQPVALAAGDAVEVALSADLVGRDYVWTWRTIVRPLAGGVSRFEQSTFFGLPVSRATLARRAVDSLPRRSTSGEVELFVLSQMDGTTTAAAIAARVHERFPARCPSQREALALVTDIAVRCAE